MSMENMTTPRRMSREQLSSLLLSPNASKLSIIDVRDDDYVGGHIKSSIHVPSSSLDYRIPEIVRTMADKETVVFHCALSQQRGPTAALRYLKERDRSIKTGKVDRKKDPPKIGIRDGSLQKVASPASKEEELKGEIEKVLESPESGANSGSGLKAPHHGPKDQEVYVLDKGFVGWQENYGNDERLTEGYVADIWADYC